MRSSIPSRGIDDIFKGFAGLKAFHLAHHVLRYFVGIGIGGVVRRQHPFRVLPERAVRRQGLSFVDIQNPFVVLADADLDTAVRAALDGAYFATGQRCTASSRLIVETGIHDQFVDALSQALQRQVVDDARKSGTTIGPVVDEKQLKQNLDYIQIGVAEGTRLVAGGTVVTRDAPGHYMIPAIFTETHSVQRINQEEIFGPVASVARATNYDEALTISNDTPFGLCAGICTTSLKYARHYQHNVDAGMVMVNLPTAGFDYHVSFGGRNASSYGAREQGKSAAGFYTVSKTTYVKS